MNNNLNSVSIITVTHKERHELLNILVQVIKNQNYNNIIEWIIVSDNNIDINFDLNIPTNIIINDNKSLGTLMNIANDNTKGDIIIIMNDDDYYFNNYICECVNKLKKSSNLLVGGDTVYIYDFILNRLYKNSLNKYIFGYKKEYLFNHKFIESNENIYEYFTDNFSVIKENILSEA
jgi:glycosyltransferase involved in cell wall biosynthesis